MAKNCLKKEPQEKKEELPDHIGEANEMVLKPCPFCGCGTHAIFYDVVEHTKIVCNRCPAVIEGGSLCSASDSWNCRTPEQGTSVVRWTRYDGAPETLPKNGLDVLVVCADQTKFTPKHATAINFWPKISEWEFSQGNIDIQKGDLWAYLPAPPEGMK